MQPQSWSTSPRTADAAHKRVPSARQLGTDVHRKRDRSSVKKYNQFRQAVYFLEKDWTKVKTAYKERGGNPLRWLCTAILGFLAAILSITWYAHIILCTSVRLGPAPRWGSLVGYEGGVPRGGSHGVGSHGVSPCQRGR